LLDRVPALPAASQIGRAARALTGAVPAPAAGLAVTVGDRGLDVSRVALLRGDLERAARHAGSPEELWRDADVTTAVPPANASGTGSADDFAPRGALWGELRGELSVADEERDTLYRVSVLAEGEVWPWSGTVIGAAGRIAVADNLVLPTRTITALVRSDRAFLADHRARLERAYIAHLWRLREDTFARVTTGYLEEAYAGTTGELLWRPHGRRYAVGARAAYAVRRDSTSQIKLFPLSIVTGHLDLYYRPPLNGLETRLSAGRYLAGDLGVTGEVARRFDNGVRIGAHITATDGDGSGTPQVSGGLRLSIPLHVLAPVATRSRATLRVEPLLRDVGQQLDEPLRLYDLTSPLAYDAIVRGWPGVLD